jgi:type I restriction enzyme, S subunit
VTLAPQEVVRAPAREWRHYPSYKVSGTQWVGNVPAQWHVSPLKRLVRTSISDGPHETPTFLDEGIPFLSVDSIQQGRLVFEGCRYISLEAHRQYIKKCKPTQGDLLLGKAASIGKVAMVEEATEFSVWSPLALIQPDRDKVESRFLYYTISGVTVQDQIELLSNKNTQKNVGMGDIENLVVPVPSLPEQLAIATFLDKETQKIDALIAKRERLIELLEEKRTALISQAVTKGLDPDVPMKDSGVGWLGEIPAHWRMKRLKHITSLITSGSRDWSQYYSDEGAVFLRIGNLTRTSINLKLDDVQRVDLPDNIEGRRTLVKEHDLVLSITAFIGSVAVAHDVGEAYVNQHIALARPRRDLVNERWVAYSLFSRTGQSQFRLSLYGGTKDGLGLDDVKNLIVPTPPPHEQGFIVSFVEGETARIDALVGKIREHIEKLREYRTALISAAVTGKIDVREET